MLKLLSRLLDTVATRFGYIHASTVASSAASQFDHEFRQLPNGKFIFPSAVDKAGRPIQFERGTAYVIGSNGRWRKRRTFAQQTSSEDTDDSPETVPAADVPCEVASAEPIAPPVPNLERKAQFARNGFRGTVEDNRVYRQWLRLHSICLTPFNDRYLRNSADAPRMVERWHHYEHFAADIAALGGIDPYMTIKQIDGDKPYGPGNIAIVRPASFESGAVSKHRKFTDIQVAHIRNAPLSLDQLVNQYGVSPATIRQIQQRRTYRDLP